MQQHVKGSKEGLLICRERLNHKQNRGPHLEEQEDYDPYLPCRLRLASSLTILQINLVLVVVSVEKEGVSKQFIFLL
jgi:hypothetical protein